MDAVFDTGTHAVEVEMLLNPGGFMGSQRLAFWLRKFGWRGDPSRREPDPIEMGTAFGLDASMDPASDWSDSSTVGFVDGGLQNKALLPGMDPRLETARLPGD